MKAIGKIIILWSLIFNSLSPALAYATEVSSAISQSEISEANSEELYSGDLIDSSASVDTGSEELTTEPTTEATTEPMTEPAISDSEENLVTGTENTESSVLASGNDEGTKSSELDSSASANQLEAAAILAAEEATPSVLYQTHVQDYGWTEAVKDGITSGTIGEAKRLEGIRISLIDAPETGGIEYQAHVENIGWMGYVSDGQLAGTTGESKRLEAIRINLTGELAGIYDIYYRVHSQNFGWLDWAKNGESAGTSGYGYRLEAIEIQLVKKDGTAPSPTTTAYMEKGEGVS